MLEIKLDLVGDNFFYDLHQRNDSMQIKRMRADYNYLQIQLDSCNKNSNTSNLEELVNRKLEEAERLKKILERKITNDEKINNNLKSIILP